MLNKTGGPAFPSSVSQGPAGDLITSSDIQSCTGMTLLDWFAGQTLVAVLSLGPKIEPKELASKVYDVSQAMIEERNRRMDE